MKKVFKLAALIWLFLGFSFGLPKEQLKPSAAQVQERPNILFVMTDDQPKDTMMAMPEVRTRVRDMGMSLSNAYVSESLCCP